MVKNSPANAGDVVPSLAREDPLERAGATHSSFLTGQIPWTEEPARLTNKWDTTYGLNNNILGV